MKKKIFWSMICLLLMGIFLGITACDNPSSSNEDEDADGMSNPTGAISVYSREDGSGTRGAFIELFGVEEKDANGEKVDHTTLSAAITNSTSVMMTSVASDENAIGYLSLGSLNDTVKAVKIDGVDASAQTVKDGSYKASRPFNIATKEDASELTEDFISFILSEQGQKIVEDNGYVAIDDSLESYTSTKMDGKIVIAGSSSINPVMEKLQESYQLLNPDVVIELQQSDSTTGMNMLAEGACDIGMASRELKDSEVSSGLNATVIALDGIAVIVNTESSVTDLTADQVKDIYVGNITTWEELA